MTTISFRTENTDAERLCAMLTAYGVQDLEINFEKETINFLSKELDEDNFSQEDLIALSQSKEEDEKGIYISSEEVHKEALNLCTK